MNAGERFERRVCLALFIGGAMVYAATFGLLAALPWGLGAFAVALAASP